MNQKLSASWLKRQFDEESVLEALSSGIDAFIRTLNGDARDNV
jgi:hypothetical protein